VPICQNAALRTPFPRRPDRHQIREDRHFLRSGGHPRIVPALGKVRLKTVPGRDLVADSGLLFLLSLTLAGPSAPCAPTEMGSAPDGCPVSGR
jgi:hypothetical protein